MIATRGRLEMGIGEAVKGCT